MIKKKQLKTALLYGEGTDEHTFFNFLLRSEKFLFLQKDWSFDTDHASGCSCVDILNSCIASIFGKKLDIVLCFIDTDDLKHDFPKIFEKKKLELEKLASEYGIEIVWQVENLEQILFEATNGKINSKGSLKTKLDRYKVQIMKSQRVKDIFNRFHSRK